MRYAFIERHEKSHAVRQLCMVMDVHSSGYYAWKKHPLSEKMRDDQRLLGLLKQAWLESGCVYGYRKLTLDMRDLGERCGKHRVARLLRLEGIRSQTGYRRRSGGRGCKPAVVAPNHLNRQFTPDGPNQSWATDITYIRTHEGWLYLAVVLDLFSRQVIGWSMGSRIDTELVLNALLMALWRRQPKDTVLVHSDQGCQFTSNEYMNFLKENQIRQSMDGKSRWADNIMIERWFRSLKVEEIYPNEYANPREFRRAIARYINEYNTLRPHEALDNRTPASVYYSGTHVKTKIDKILNESSGSLCRI